MYYKTLFDMLDGKLDLSNFYIKLLKSDALGKLLKWSLKKVSKQNKRYESWRNSKKHALEKF